MTPDQITSLAKQAGFLIDEAPISQPYVIQATRYKIDDELQRFAELVRNEAIDKRVKVKIGDQYGNDLNGHWFYLQPADEKAQKVLDNRSMKK